MRTKKYVSVEAEVEIDINPKDFLASIPSGPERKELILSGLNQTASFMKSISDQIISEMTDVQCEVIYDFFKEQTERYKRI